MMAIDQRKVQEQALEVYQVLDELGEELDRFIARVEEAKQSLKKYERIGDGESGPRRGDVKHPDRPERQD